MVKPWGVGGGGAALFLQAQSRSAAVFGDELDASLFQYTDDCCEIVSVWRAFVVFKIDKHTSRYIGCFGKRSLIHIQ